MNAFYAAIDRDSTDDTIAGEFLVLHAGKDNDKLLARCQSENWSCAIVAALNAVDQAKEVEWPK